MKNDPIPFWENPAIQEINRLPARSNLLPFEDIKDALSDAVAGPLYRSFLKDNPRFMSLDGIWDFILIKNPNDDLKPQDESHYDLSKWIEQGFDAKNWHNINVPGTWSRQGGNSRFENCFDKPHYTNVQMPFQANPPNTPLENPTGLYRRTFILPDAWKKRRVILHIGSAESAALVYINGFFAGAGKDTRLPQEYDITPFIHDGENLLCVKVVRYSDASYVEDQDQWWLGGIHRSVYLYSTGDCYVKDIKALPGIISASCGGNTEGKIKINVTLGGKLPESRSTGNGETSNSKKSEDLFTVKCSLYPFRLPQSVNEAKEIALSMLNEGSLSGASVEFVPDYRLNSDTACAQLLIDNPKAWSHEAPNLYVICAELSRNGVPCECYAFCTGFRNIEIKNRELLINGKAVYIKGVNRHEHDEKTGKTLCAQSMLRDIKILKSHNFNAVRTSHYPDDERWYELCDRYGIYLWNEANIESHCFWTQLCDDQSWSYAFLLRMQRMVLRDKNHVCVAVWSLGNESGCGSNHEAGAAWIRSYDRDRPVHYEGAMRGKGSVLERWQQGRTLSDIVCPMYPEIENIIDFSKYTNDQRPLIMCEYSHAMGNSNGSLGDYWKAIYSHHGLQGGFIWEWIDHGFEAYSQDGRKYWKYGGDFDDEPSDLDFVCDGLLFPDQSLKPAMAECKQVFAPLNLKEIPGKPFTFILENNYDFSKLDHLCLEYKFFEDNSGDLKEKILKKETIDLPDLEPGQKTEISFNIDSSLIQKAQNALVFHADFILKEDTQWADKGHVVCQAQKIYKENKIIAQDAFMGKSQAKKLPLDIPSIFTPCLYRAATQNDGLKTYIKLRGDPAMSFYYKNKAMYHWIDLDLLHLTVCNEKKEDVLYDGVPAVFYSADLLAGESACPEYRRYKRSPGLGSFSYYLTRGTPAVFEAVFDLDPALPELPRVGLTARIPSSYKEISWFGAGPHESYPDRMEAAFLGRYRHSIEDFEVSYIVPQENGSRSGVRNFTLVNEDTQKNITIFAEKPVSIGCSKYSLENLWEALHTYDLKEQGADNGWFLFIDIARRGAGTATCGPDTREEYRVRPGLYKIKLYIKS